MSTQPAPEPGPGLDPSLRDRGEGEGASGAPAGSANEHDLGFALPEPMTMSRTRAIGIGVLVVAVLAAAFVFGYAPRRRARAALEAGVVEAQGVARKVEVVTPKVGSSDRALTLPGSVEPLEVTTIYPRASGYVRKWVVDIGDKVQEGQLLAEIDTPELDQQLEQANAQLAQAQAQVVQSKANRDFSKTNLERYRLLVPQGLAATQDLEQKQAQAQVDEANVNVAAAAAAAQEANIRRLLQLKSFGRVTAPFAGTITSRKVDRGALVTAGNATPLFTVAATDPVRVYVQVPQDAAPSVRAGAPATVHVRELPSAAFEAKVTRSAGALDPSSRTLNTEVRVPNPDGKLLVGMYAEVALTLPSPHRVFEVPSTAVLADARGVRVAVVTPEGKLHLVPVTIERDTGSTMLLASGLGGTERVVKLATADLAEGEPVTIAP